MSEIIAQYQVGTFATPNNGDALDATVVKGNDNTIKTSHNAHDVDSGIHFQSSTVALRPVAGTPGRKWYTSDTKRVFYDSGSAWDEISYLPLAGATMTGAPAFSAGFTSTGGTLTGAHFVTPVVDSGGLSITLGGLTVSAGGAAITGGITGALTGNVTGNVTGNLTGTVLTAAQTNITSLGTLTALTVNNTAQSDIALSATPTNVIQIQLGGGSTNGSLGTIYSSGHAYLAHNTLQTAKSTDSWTQQYVSLASSMVEVGENLVEFYGAVAGKVAANRASFWGTAKASINTSSGVITTGGGLVVTAGGANITGTLNGGAAVFSGNVSAASFTGPTTIDASLLTGTTMAASVIASSLTSVGTLTSLTSSGQVLAATFKTDGTVLTTSIGNTTTRITAAASHSEIQFGTDDTGYALAISKNNAGVVTRLWRFIDSGHHEPNVDNTYNLGSAIRRVATVYAATFTGNLTGNVTGNVTGTLTGNVTGNVSGSSGSSTGNAATATALATPRAINGTNFDGTAAITITAAAGTLTGATLAAGVTASSLTSVGASLLINSQTALHAGNYTSYAPSLSGAGATGSWGISVTGTAGNITAYTINQSVGTSNTVTHDDITSRRVATPTTGYLFLGNSAARYLGYDGTIYVMPGAQLDVNGSRVLNAGNYNTYSPTLTGTGASGSWGISVTGSAASATGNAGTATALQTARAINGVNFDGTAAITVAAAAGTLTGATLAAGVTGSSLTSVGTLATLTVTATITGAVSGNAGTATALQTARAINGVNFDGTAAITVAAAAGTLTGGALAAGVTSSSLTTFGAITSLSASSSFDTGTAHYKAGSSTSVSTITTIYTLSVNGNIVTVFGDNGGGVNQFIDVVAATSGGTTPPPVLLSSTIIGTPATRTYAVSAGSLRLTMASGTYTVKTAPLEIS